MRLVRTIWSRFVLLERGLTPLQICIVYVVLAGAWILLSDRFAVSIISDVRVYSTVSQFKGWVFVLVSAAMLYGLIARLSRDLKRSEQQHAEYARELRCLYALAKIAETPDLPLPQILEQIADRVPQAFPHGESVCVLIRIDTQSYGRPQLVDCQWQQSVPIVISGKVRGSVSVGCNQTIAPDAGHPFRPADLNLIKAVAREIAGIVERQESKLSQDRLQQQLAHTDRLASLGMMAATIAHEVNNPLTTMKALIHTLRDERSSTDPRRDDYDIVLGEIDKLKSLILRFLQFARPGDLQIDWIDLGSTIVRIVGLIRPQALATGITISESHDDFHGVVHADNAQIGQVVLNILLNAIDATPDGGQIRISLTDDGPKNARLTIWNSGPPLDPSLAERIFDPFFSTKATGTGLGLSIARIIVEKHHGRLWGVGESDGTSFHLTLPRRTEQDDA